MREFIHVDDLASAIEFLLKNYDNPEIINVGSGQEISISDLATLIADVVGFEGNISRDLSKPDGTPRKILDSSRLHAMGWSPRWQLRDGIVESYAWFLENAASLRMV